MAERIEAFSVFALPGVESDAADETEISFAPGEVERIEIFVPPGHGGLTGFALAQAGQRIIPYDGETFIVTAGEHISWPTEKFLNTGSWSMFTYNTDIAVHWFYVRFLLKEIRNAQSLPVLVQPLQFA